MVKTKNKGVFYMVLACILFAWMGAFVKILSTDFSAIQIVFFRNVFGTIVILITLIKYPMNNKGGKPYLLIFRGIMGTLSLYALFYNMGSIGLGEAVTYLQTSPIFIAIFSLLLLKERLSKIGWFAIFLGFIGILMIFRPEMGFSLKTSMIGLFNGIGAALAYTAVRELKQYYDTRAIVLSFMISGVILPLISMIYGEIFGLSGQDFLVSEFVMPHAIQWVWILLVGLTAMVGQYLLTMAYGIEKAGIVSAVGYLTIPFSIVVGFLLGDPFPGFIGILGMALIVVSGLLITYRKGA